MRIAVINRREAIQLQTMTKGGLKYDLNDYLDRV